MNAHQRRKARRKWLREALRERMARHRAFLDWHMEMHLLYP